MFSDLEAAILVKDLREMVKDDKLPINVKLTLKAFMFDLQGDDFNKQHMLKIIHWLKECHLRAQNSKKHEDGKEKSN